MSWKHQLYEIFRAEKWAIQSPGLERGHMIYPQSFKVSLMHTNFVTRSQKNLMFWIFFAQALLLLFKKRRKVSGQKMRTAYRIVRLLITFLGTLYSIMNLNRAQQAKMNVQLISYTANVLYVVSTVICLPTKFTNNTL